MATARHSTESPDGVKLGEYIRAQRETLGISQRRLAGRIGLHHSYLARLEAGDYAQPAPAVLHRIAEALDLEPEDLFALAGHTIPHELPRGLFSWPHRSGEQLRLRWSSRMSQAADDNRCA